MEVGVVDLTDLKRRGDKPMKILVSAVLLTCLGAFAGAQNANPPQPAQPAVTAPAQPAAVAPAQQQPAPAPTMTIEELRKKHIDAVAELKKKNVDELKAFRETLKGKPEAERKQAVEAKKKELQEAVKSLQKANKAEIEQFRKDHPKPAKKEGKHKPAKN
jgi:hypothetical protein